MVDKYTPMILQKFPNLEINEKRMAEAGGDKNIFLKVKGE
jgi:hypothetical protein